MKNCMTKAISMVLAAVLFAGVLLSGVNTISSQAAEDPAAYAAVFDAAYYRAANPDLASVFGMDDQALFNHFVKYGMAEGRQASAEFNVAVYKARYADLAAAFGDNLKLYYLHYINMGKAEGRNGKVAAPAPVKPAPVKQEVKFDKPVYLIREEMGTYRSKYEEGTCFSDREKFRWTGGVVDTASGKQAFAFMLSEASFKDLPARVLYGVSASSARVGDIIRFDNDSHMAVVFENNGTFVVVAEVTQDTVHWDVQIPLSSLEDRIDAVITRYPQ